MGNKHSLEVKGKVILDYIKQNSKATHIDIRKELKLNPNRYFKSLEEAFKLAGVTLPRTFKKKTKDEKIRIIIDYIKKHPKAGSQTMAKETKINPSNIFESIEEAFKLANVPYPRIIDKRDREEKIEEIIRLVKENPLITTPEIMDKTKTQPYHFFKNIKEIYKEAGINPVNGRKKWRLKKQQEVIRYIKENPLATQRQINNSCKTHVQITFKGGIFEAYKRAEIKFPYERLKLYGIGIKEIRERAKTFEDQIALKLSGYGKINRLVKTKRGFADIILERKNRKVIIEVKDYEDKDIPISQINQLNKYLEDCNCNLGFLICKNKPKKDSFLIGKNTILVLEETELNRLPELIDGSVV